MKSTIKTITAIVFLAITIGCADEKNEFTDTEKNNKLVTEILETTTVTTDDYLYVTAPSGLSLREFNNLDSEKLVVMPYGSKVKLISIEENETMTVGGIKGGMHEIEYNNKKGYAFNGYLSSFFPPEKNGVAKQYIEDLKATHPSASYVRETGGTASNPTERILVTLPTNRWHEAYSIAQRLFDVPAALVFPNPAGRDTQTINNPKTPDYMFVSDLKVERKDNQLQKITYSQAGEGYGSQVIITKEGDLMTIESSTVAD